MHTTTLLLTRDANGTPSRPLASSDILHLPLLETKLSLIVTFHNKLFQTFKRRGNRKYQEILTICRAEVHPLLKLYTSAKLDFKGFFISIPRGEMFRERGREGMEVRERYLSCAPVIKM